MVDTEIPIEIVTGVETGWTAAGAGTPRSGSGPAPGRRTAATRAVRIDIGEAIGVLTATGALLGMSCMMITLTGTPVRTPCSGEPVKGRLPAHREMMLNQIKGLRMRGNSLRETTHPDLTSVYRPIFLMPYPPVHHI